MNRKFIATACAIVFIITAGYRNANAGVIGVIDPQGSTSSNAATAAANLGHTSSNITTASVAGASAASLIASYDALIVSWYGGSYPTNFWANTLLPYIQGGGGLIFDGASSATSMLAGSGLTTGGASTFSSGSQTVTDNSVTSAVTVHGANHHLGGLSGNSDWTEFLKHSSTTLGMHATFGSGRIIVTSTDFFYHGTSPTSFMTDELRFVTTGAVPEPTSLAIFGLGALGLVAGGLRRRKQKTTA